MIGENLGIQDGILYAYLDKDLRKNINKEIKQLNKKKNLLVNNFDAVDRDYSQLNFINNRIEELENILIADKAPISFTPNLR